MDDITVSSANANILHIPAHRDGLMTGFYAAEDLRSGDMLVINPSTGKVEAYVAIPVLPAPIVQDLEEYTEQSKALIRELRRILKDYDTNGYLHIGPVLHCIQYEDKGYTAEQCVSHLWGDCGYTRTLEHILGDDESEESNRLFTELYRLFILLKNK